MADEEPSGTIGNRYPVDVIERVNADAARLDLSQSEWMRMAVLKLLARPVSQKEADRYRRPPTKAEIRAAQRQSRLDRQAAG